MSNQDHVCRKRIGSRKRAGIILFDEVQQPGLRAEDIQDGGQDPREQVRKLEGLVGGGGHLVKSREVASASLNQGFKVFHGADTLQSIPTHLGHGGQRASIIIKKG